MSGISVIYPTGLDKIMKIKNGTQCQGRNIQVNTFSTPSLLIYYGFYSNLHLLFRIQLR
jgi:hypothetical protein